MKVVFSAQIPENGGFETRSSGSCFDLFGADILLRRNWQPVLLEVNNGPQIAVTSENSEVHSPLRQRGFPNATSKLTPSPRVQTSNAVHAQVVADAVPLLAVPRAPAPEPGTADSLFLERLASFMHVHELHACKASGTAQDCVSRESREELWRAHEECVHRRGFERVYPAPSTLDLARLYLTPGAGGAAARLLVLWAEQFTC